MVLPAVLALALAVPADAPLVAIKSAGKAEDVGNGVVVQPLLAADDVKGLRARFRVDAPPDVVLETLWDVHRFRKIFPDIHSLTVVAERPGEVDARFTVDAVLATVSYTLRRDVDRAARTVVWKSIGGDLKLVRGSWTVTPVPGDTRQSDVVYTSFVDVGTFVPTGMVRDIAMGKVEQMAGRVRAACAEAVAQRSAAIAKGPATTTEVR